MNSTHAGGQQHSAVQPDGGLRLLLSPGHPILLQCGEGERFFRATVLGVKPGEFIIAKPPSFLLSGNKVQADGSVRIKLEDEGVVYGFDSRVLSVLKHPVPILFLAYPKSFEVHSLRLHPRLKCLLPAMIESTDFACQGHMLDISLGGCRVAAQLRDSSGSLTAGAGDSLDVRLPLFGLRMETITCQVRQRTVEKGVLTLGLAFPEAATDREIANRLFENLTRLEGLIERDCLEPAKPAPDRQDGCSLRGATASVGDAGEVDLRVLKPLDIQFTGSHLFEQSTILGVDGASTVIAEMPHAAGLKSCPKPGMGLRGRFENHGSSYGFMTSVTKFVTMPRPLVFFAYPKKIEILIRRKHTRVKCHLPAKFENEHCTGSGYVTDISLGGCRVIGALDNGENIHKLEIGAKIQVALPLEGLRIEHLQGAVKTFCLSGTLITLGVVFCVDKKQGGRLARFMSRMETAAE